MTYNFPFRLIALASLIFFLSACGSSAATDAADAPSASGAIPDSAESLVVAGGCFWCVEKDFESRADVYEAISGYAGGDNRDATYRNHHGHREVVEVYYDPAQTSYGELVRFFLRTIDVTDAGGQFCDRGRSYTTVIHYRSDSEKAEAEAAIAEAEAQLGLEIVTPVEPMPFFVTAEDYHQDYYKSEDKIPTRFGLLTKADAYKRYRKGCGRDARVKEVWGEDAATH